MAFNPQALAQALASQPKEAPRSKYLEQALKSMEASGQNIQGGGGELAARLLAQAITQRAYKKASTEERAAERERQASIMSTLNLGGMVAPTGAAQPQAPMSAPPAPAMPPTAIGPGMDGEPIGPPPAALAAAMQPQQPPAQAPPAMAPAAQGGLPSYRDAAPALLAGQLMGAPEASMIGEILQGAAPQLKDVNGMILDMSDPSNTGRYVPQFDKGQEPLMDSSGRVVAVRNMDGSVRSAAEMAGAVARAQESAKAGYDLVEVPVADGSTRMLPRDQALQTMGGGMAPTSPAQPTRPPATGGPGSGFGVRQSPAQQARDVGLANVTVETAKARQAAAAILPKVEDQAAFTIGILDKIRSHPSFEDRTGNSAVLPPLRPQDVDFDALVDQVGGGAFLTAIESLRGSGQITEIEGKKATDAIARMTRQRQSAEGFRDAMADYQSVVQAGVERARLAAGASGSRATAPPPAERQPGQVYQTPRGPMKWTGTGWLPQ